MNMFKTISTSTVPHFIGGESAHFPGEEKFQNVSPSSGEVINDIVCGGKEAIMHAVASCQNALEQSNWSKRPVSERAAIVRRIGELILENKEDLARLESLDSGKPISESLTGDIPRAANNFIFYADLAENDEGLEFSGPGSSVHKTIREPIGIVGLITPWNLPLYLESWKVAPALVCGNAVVLKPAELTPMTAYALGQIAIEAGLPKGLLNVVQGFGPKAAGEYLVSHPDVGAISFTGETRTGQSIASVAAPMLKKLSFELGGKGVSIVFADSDLEKASGTVAKAAFRNQGQICLAGSRLLVEASVKDEFLTLLSKHVEAIKLGDPLVNETTMGALVSHDHRDRVAGFVERCVAEGGKVLIGGRKPKLDGAYFEPTLIEGVEQDSEIIQSEVFGPVLTVQEFHSKEQALEMANGTSYGLSASVWTRDSTTMEEMTSGLRTGLVWQNSWFLRNLNTAFGGMKSSGVGREGGMYSLNFFSELKTISRPSK